MPMHIIYDNGSTFLAAAPEMKEICADQEVHTYLTSKGLEWSFIPKQAPWFGGFCKHLVGVTKTALKKVLVHQLASLDEIVTLVTEAVIYDWPWPIHLLPIKHRGTHTTHTIYVTMWAYDYIVTELGCD